MVLVVIWGSYGDDYKDGYRLGCDAVTSQRIMMLPPSKNLNKTVLIKINKSNRYMYKYVNLLYYKERSLLHVSAIYCGHLQGGVLWKYIIQNVQKHLQG